MEQTRRPAATGEGPRPDEETVAALSVQLQRLEARIGGEENAEEEAASWTTRLTAWTQSGWFKGVGVTLLVVFFLKLLIMLGLMEEFPLDRLARSLPDLMSQLLDWPFLLFLGVVWFVRYFRKDIAAWLRGERGAAAPKDGKAPPALDPVQQEIDTLRRQLDEMEQAFRKE